MKEEDGLLAGLRQHFVDDFRDRLDTMEALVRDTIAGKLPPEEGLPAFRRELHSLKGTGTTFGFPTVTLICHKAEEYLSQARPNEFPDALQISAFLDPLGVLLEQSVDLAEDDRTRLIEGLPSYRSPDAAAKVLGDKPTEALLVVGSRTIRHKLRLELEQFNFKVTSVSSGLEAFGIVSHWRPAVAIISGTIDEMDGFDLIRALDAMEATRDIPLIAVTSLARNHAKLQTLPDSVPVLRLDENIASEIADSLTDLEFRKLLAAV